VVLGAQRTGFGRTRHIGGIGRTAHSAHFSSLKLPQPKKSHFPPQSQKMSKMSFYPKRSKISKISFCPKKAKKVKKVKNFILPQKVNKGQKSHFAPIKSKISFCPKKSIKVKNLILPQ
jgi:hypothetical protein